ncbi:hypothetical protein BSBH6_03657 [Bacillus subtilis]|nr:hypothetical protein BSBH6_03657 [Bacillus subtilis]RPK22396.1 hypothetical protein BH5_03661 [Bacillus subtilis]
MFSAYYRVFNNGSQGEEINKQRLEKYDILFIDIHSQLK